MKVENILCHSFCSELLSDAKIAFDCGSNHGEFAEWLCKYTKAEIYSFEPDPRLFPELPRLNRVTYFQVAISGFNGEMGLALGSNNCSSTVFKESNEQEIATVKTINLEYFCTKRNLSSIDFLKMDIEGAEIDIFENTSDDFLRSIKQITIEFHDFIDKNDIPKIKEIFSRMRKLGFFCVNFSHHTWGDCLFINTKYYPLSFYDRFTISCFNKYMSGFQRIFRKIVK